MIVLFTDYGLQGPYIGQVEAMLHRYAPTAKVINLFADLPRQNPKAAAYLLAAYSTAFPENSIFFCVVDPEVGSGEDKPIVIKAGQQRFVGPHNGLFDIVTRREEKIDCWEITWQPEKLSDSFHGRDLYAPVCAMLANQQPVPGKSMKWYPRYNWPENLEEIIYLDHFGNAMTGIRSGVINENAVIRVGDNDIKHATTFAKVKQGQAFWYNNANGLVEIAVNQGSAEESLTLQIGTSISF